MINNRAKRVRMYFTCTFQMSFVSCRHFDFVTRNKIGKRMTMYFAFQTLRRRRRRRRRNRFFVIQRDIFWF